MKFLKYFLAVILISYALLLSSQPVKTSKEKMIFTAVNGKTSKNDFVSFYNYSGGDLVVKSVKITGQNASFFSVVSQPPSVIDNGTSFSPELRFSPAAGKIGPFQATLEVKIGDEEIEVPLHGLSLLGLEGKNEPPLADVLKVLGFKADIGWTTLANHTRNELQGEEISSSLFKKAANTETIQLIPVARFSPDFPLPFGYYYPNQKTIPKLNQVGELAEAGSWHQHQTLYPELKRGSTAFDPGSDAFGIYTYSPSHIAFSQDFMNSKYYPDQATHAVRTFPLRDSEGKLIQNAYLVAFEEAKNGDYQDYVFILQNVIPQ
ncbi:MAG: hypothetical protein ACNS62_21805 [Candidatus Cyclobacteriaceae bacterium M3_2C_046]